MKIRYTQDPGHGWIHVRRNVLQGLGISDKITHFSYQKGNMVYLEEDVDAGTFFKALKEKKNLSVGEGVEVVHSYYDKSCYIRSLESYRV